MRDKNNWSHKNDLKQEKLFKKMMAETVLDKPNSNTKCGVLWGTHK